MLERLNRNSPRHLLLRRKFAQGAGRVQTRRNRHRTNDRRKHNLRPRSLARLVPDQLAADAAAGAGADVAAVGASRRSLKPLLLLP
jgi:hypothetical protein